MNEKEQIRNLLDQMFESKPKTRQIIELKEELLANSLEKYDDLLGQGIQPKDAVDIVINGIGDIDELVDIPQEIMPSQAKLEQERKRSALILSISVGLYIIAGLIIINGGLTIGIAMAILPTCLLVYNANSKPVYHKQNNTVIEEFKEWNQSSKKSAGLFAAISGVIWSLAVVIFLATGTLFDAWHIAWIIFIVAVCVEAIVLLVFKIREIR